MEKRERARRRPSVGRFADARVRRACVRAYILCLRSVDNTRIRWNDVRRPYSPTVYRLTNVVRPTKRKHVDEAPYFVLLFVCVCVCVYAVLDSVSDACVRVCVGARVRRPMSRDEPRLSDDENQLDRRP